MSINHQQYLEQVLESLEIRMNEEKTVHRINIATHEARMEAMDFQHSSISRQLRNNGANTEDHPVMIKTERQIPIKDIPMVNPEWNK